MKLVEGLGAIVTDKSAPTLAPVERSLSTALNIASVDDEDLDESTTGEIYSAAAADIGTESAPVVADTSSNFFSGALPRKNQLSPPICFAVTGWACAGVGAGDTAGVGAR